MAYRMKWYALVEWEGPGMGGGTRGNAQVTRIQNTVGINSPGFGAGGAINATDITNMVATISADLTAQLNANPLLAQIQGWPTGAP